MVYVKPCAGYNSEYKIALLIDPGSYWFAVHMEDKTCTQIIRWESIKWKVLWKYYG